jgi:hypothetical protein
VKSSRGGDPTAHAAMDYSFDELNDAVLNCTDSKLTIRDDGEHLYYVIDDEEFDLLDTLYDYLVTKESIRQFLEEEVA